MLIPLIVPFPLNLDDGSQGNYRNCILIKETEFYDSCLRKVFDLLGLYEEGLVLTTFCRRCSSCAQCFRPFPDGVFYEFEGRKYCEHDFHVLFAPCCGKCGELKSRDLKQPII